MLSVVSKRPPCVVPAWLMPLRLSAVGANARCVTPVAPRFSSSKGGNDCSPPLRTPSFDRLVRGLRDQKRTVSVVESSCGGLFSASLMSVPGSSAVYYGGTTAYNTRKVKPLLCDDDELHTALLATDALRDPKDGETEGEAYVNSKLRWTAEAALAYGRRLKTDYVVAEGGATGPTFRPVGMKTGFAALTVAGRRRRPRAEAYGDGLGDDARSGKEGDGGDGDEEYQYEVLSQTVVRSTHADREANMRLFADAAADLCADAAGVPALEENEVSSSGGAHVPWLDRSSHLRSDTKALRHLEKSPDTLHVVLRGDEVLFRSPTELALLPGRDVDARDEAGGEDDLERSFLGRVGASQTPVFAVSLPAESIADGEALTDANKEFLGKSLQMTQSEPAYFGNTRTLAPLLTPNHNELALYATALFQYRRSHRYCNHCGAPVRPIYGGTGLRCTNDDGCGTPTWPRQDPSIIVLVSNRDSSKALLARSKRHPPKLYTALAGFVEAGETFESAVAREAHEETGIRVDPDGVRYVASQPWPFPRSTMIGFRATADDGAPLDVDMNELVDAKWFDRDVVRKAAELSTGATMRKEVAREVTEKDPNLELLVPPRGVLARRLIDDWLREDS